MLVCSDVPAACWDSSGMDPSAQDTRAAELQPHTNTHSGPLLQSLHHIRGMFSGRFFVCWQDSHKSPARSRRATSHAGSRLTSLSLWLPTTEPTGGLGVPTGLKASRVPNTNTHTHAHTDGLDINNTWAKPLKSSSSRELLEWINLAPAERWCTINSKSSITRVIMHNKTNQNRKQFHPGDPLLKHSTLNFAKARTAWCQMKQSR